RIAVERNRVRECRHPGDVDGRILIERQPATAEIGVRRNRELAALDLGAAGIGVVAAEHDIAIAGDDHLARAGLAGRIVRPRHIGHIAGDRLGLPGGLAGANDDALVALDEDALAVGLAVAAGVTLAGGHAALAYGAALDGERRALHDEDVAARTEAAATAS